MTEMTVRLPLAADVPAMKAIIAATALFPPGLLDDMMSGYLSGEPCPDIWMVSDPGGITGLAYCAPERMTEGTWNLYLIAVHPDSHGAGHGTALLARIEADVTARGAHLLLVETSGLPEFAATREFYLRRGFVEEARVRDYYQVGDDKIIFRKVVAVPPLPA